MEKLIVNTYIRLITPLGAQTKQALLAWLASHLKEANPDFRDSKEQLLDELAGSWSGTPDDFSDTILGARTTSQKAIDWK